MEPENQSADARRHLRLKIEVDIRIQSRTCGVLKGYTVDISESGIAAMLRIEVPLGEIVELISISNYLHHGCRYPLQRLLHRSQRDQGYADGNKHR